MNSRIAERKLLADEILQTRFFDSSLAKRYHDLEREGDIHHYQSSIRPNCLIISCTELPSTYTYAHRREEGDRVRYSTGELSLVSEHNLSISLSTLFTEGDATNDLNYYIDEVYGQTMNQLENEDYWKQYWGTCAGYVTHPSTFEIENYEVDKGADTGSAIFYLYHLK